MQSLPLRRAKEGRHHDHTVQYLRPIAGSRRNLLGIVEDASLRKWHSCLMQAALVRAALGWRRTALSKFLLWKSTGFLDLGVNRSVIPVARNNVMATQILFRL